MRLRSVSLAGILVTAFLAGCISRDTHSPFVQSTTPSNLEVNVSLNASIVIRFSEPVDRESAQASLIIIPLMVGNFTWNPEGTEMAFQPSERLWPQVQYVATIQATARDRAGNEMKNPYSFTFKVGEAQPEEAELEGHMVWVKEYPEEYEPIGQRKEWTSYQVKKEDIVLVFKPKEGRAAGVSILLDLGEVDFTEANQTWAEREGLFQWRFTYLETQAAIRVTIMCPQLPSGIDQRDYGIVMYYQYTNKPRVKLDEKVLTVRLLE